jgi:release factor glutamine methyltransferase
MTPLRTIGDALRYARTLPTLDAITTHALIAHVTGRDRAWIVAHQEDLLTDEQSTRLLDLLGRAAHWEPLAYLTGAREFAGLRFEVTPDVLIPRPETETLVDAVVAWAKKAARPLRIIDVGTGSGVIAVTLAARLPDARITAADVSESALAVARRNAERHQAAERIAFVESDLLETVAGTFDVIAANLPYIARDDLAALEVSRWEPGLALDGGPEGLDLIRRLLAQAPARLASGGTIFLEIGSDQGERAAALRRDAFPGAQVRVLKDLGNRDRVAIVETERSHD